MEIQNFAGKLELALRERGWTQETLAKKAGITPRYLSKVKKAGDNVPELLFEKLCKALETTPKDFNRETTHEDQYFPVPLREAAGGMGGGTQVGSRKIISYVSLRRDFLLTKTSNLDHLSFIHAYGESMFPTIPPDALVLIDEGQTEPMDGKIYYIMWNDSLLIKRLEVKNGTITAVISDNGEKKDALGEQDSVQILGRALLQLTSL